MDDIYDNGKPKYQEPQDIYEAVQAMASGEEIGILSEMYADVSWEGQDYYYTDAGGKLLERWESLTEYGDKMWPVNIAAWQMDGGDANEWFWDILYNDELAKRIGWKKIFTDIALSGMKNYYDKAASEFLYQLGNLDKFEYHQNAGALKSALDEVGLPSYAYLKIYSELCSAVYKKMRGLKLESERQLIVESRSVLTSYDDFMFGLRANQRLFNQQETQYKNKCAQLQENYKKAVSALLTAAQAQGIVLQIPEAPKIEDHLTYQNISVEAENEQL